MKSANGVDMEGLLVVYLFNTRICMFGVCVCVSGVCVCIARQNIKRCSRFQFNQIRREAKGVQDKRSMKYTIFSMYVFVH